MSADKQERHHPGVWTLETPLAHPQEGQQAKTEWTGGQEDRRVKASLGLRALPSALLRACSGGRTGGVREAAAQNRTRKRAQAVWRVGTMGTPASGLPKLSWFQS